MRRPRCHARATPLYSKPRRYKKVVPQALWAWQRVYFGTNPATAGFPELTAREAAVLVPFALLAILLGVWPSLLTNWMEPSVAGWIENMSVLKP